MDTLRISMKWPRNRVEINKALVGQEIGPKLHWTVSAILIRTEEADQVQN